MMMFQTVLSHISAYGLLAAGGGIAVCLWLFCYERHCSIRLAGDIDLAVVCGLIGAVIGAKLLYFVTVWPALSYDISLLTCAPGLFAERYLYAGFVYYGGVMGYFSAIALYAKLSKARYTELAAPLVPALALFHVFGRLGCLLQGCCYGVRTQGRFAVVYHRSAIAPHDVPLFPVQLVEACLEAIVFILLLNCLRRGTKGKILTAIYLVAYGACRFVMEFFRGDSYRGIFYGVSLSQYLSLLGIAAGTVMICLGKRKKSTDSCSTASF